MAFPKIHLQPQGSERIIYIAQRHPIALVMRAIGPFVAGLIAALVFVNRALTPPTVFGPPPPLLGDPWNLALLAIVLVCIAALVYIWFDWANDHIILTNQRVVEEDRTLFLAYEYRIIPLDQIQNVNIRIENFVQYTLDYGRVEIQAAGPTEPIVFNRALRPRALQTQILGEVRREKRKQEQERLNIAIARHLDPSVPPFRQTPPPSIRQTTHVGGLLQSVLPLYPTVQNNVITWHRHWIILLRNLIGPFLALGVWALLFWAIPRFDLLDPTPTVVILFLGFIGVIGYFYWQYDDWLNDIYILEPTQLIDVSRLPFGLFEDRRQAPLGVIQNVRASAPSLIARILGYGDVLIETAGQAGNFTFDHVPDPDEVQRIVFEYREEARWQQREREWQHQMDIVDKYQGRRLHQNPPQS